MNKFEGAIKQLNDLDEKNRYGFSLRITKQPEEVNDFTATNGYVIKSSSIPEVRLNDRVIYVKGRNLTKDSCLFRASYDEVHEIAAALKEFSSSLNKRVSQHHRLTSIFR